ncbi:MAG: hypothetical protein M0Q91_13260 [Methanoregula sp.]|jgi:hypothetical protein|nr:hypothetical protein [Methanoregula sp.]
MEIKEAREYLTEEIKKALEPLKEKGIVLTSVSSRVVDVSSETGYTTLVAGYTVKALYEGATFEIHI